MQQPASTAAPANQGQTNAAANPTQYDTDFTDPNAAMPANLQAQPQIGTAASPYGQYASPTYSQPGAAALPGMEKGGEVHPMAHAQHPVWPLLHKAAGIEAPNDRNGQPLMMSNGGRVPGAPPVSLRPPAGPLPANFGSAKGYAVGGPVVGNNYGSLTKRPEFTRGGIPGDGRGVSASMLGGPYGAEGMANGGPVSRDTSMGQGITPASTDGQVLTYADGGSVPLGMPPSGSNDMMNMSGDATPQVSGRAAGFSAGLAPGMAMGHNLRAQWEQHEARSAIQGGQSAEEQGQVDAYRLAHGLPTEAQQQQGGGIMHDVHTAVSKVFDLLHSQTKADNGQRNTQPLPGSTTAAAPGQAAPAPVAPTAPPAPPQAIAAPGVTGGAAPTGAAPPSAGVPGPTLAAAAGQPGATPAPPAAPPNPAVAVGAKAQAGAAQAGAPPAQAAQTAESAKNAAASLTPASTPGKAPGEEPNQESLTAKDWENTERAKWKAARAATAAGMDGNQVYESLTQLQTAHFQGQYLKWIGAAAQAQQNNDQPGVEKALRAASYYLPNGQPLQLHKATADDVKANPGVEPGQFIVQNPFYGMPGHENDSKQVPINAMTLASMGQAALDPVAFGTGQQAMYKLGIYGQTELMKAKGAEDLGGGRNLQGQAAVVAANAKARLEPYQGELDSAHAKAYLAQAYKDAQAGTGGGLKVTASNILGAQKAAGTAFDNAALGEQNTQPAQISIGVDPKTGQPVMQANPRAGQTFRDATKVAPLFRGMTPDERQQARVKATDIAGQNVGEISGDEAADIAARMQIDERVAAKNGGVGGTHTDPASGKPRANVVHGVARSPHDQQDHPAIWVWMGNKWSRHWATPNGSNDQGVQHGIESGASDNDQNPDETTRRPLIQRTTHLTTT